MARISVFGIGYVGVVSAACLARDGHQVIAVDVDPAKIAAINAGLSPIVENGLDPLIRQVVDAGKLTATDDVQFAIDNTDRKSTRLNSSHLDLSRMPSSA